jgi:hypothetical protein
MGIEGQPEKGPFARGGVSALYSPAGSLTCTRLSVGTQ